MDINTLLCNDDSKNDKDVEMKNYEEYNTANSSSNDNLPMLSELNTQPNSGYEYANPVLYSTTSSSNVMISNNNNEDMPNMKALSINSPTSAPLTPPTPPTNIISSKLDSLSGIAAATAALRQRKHVRNSPRPRKSILSSGSGSPGGNYCPYNPTASSSRHRFLNQPPPNHPISTAILRHNRIQNGIRNVVRGVSDSLFTHNNERQLNFFSFPRYNQNTSANQATSSSQTNATTPSSSTSYQSSQQTMPDTNLNQDDVNHGIKCCLQWLKYAIVHLDQEINLLRNIANESFHLYCNNIQNRRNANSDTNNNLDNKDNSNMESEYQGLDPSASTENSNQQNGLNSQFQLGSNQVTNYRRKSLVEIKRDIVYTIRRTVEIIVKGASKYLPDESRVIIRRFILSLPSRLSKLTQRPEAIKPSITSSTNDENKDSNTNTSEMSMSSSYMTTSEQQMNDKKDEHDKAAKEESLKIMTLATEGNDMLKKMMDVFEKSFQENNKNNLDNVNLINTNEGSTINYNTNKMFYNPMNANNNNNMKLPKMNNNNTYNTPNNTTNSNYVINDSMSYKESQRPVNTN
ncbi:hypothetical protein BCR36DRAFT_405115 [Piromyces finnis]|uniref:Opi1-domain-containing protein n=1 Tax=Piromyces finnis TaxID=1754191 RepID=A0A1Y1V731_9FUNG|nr:hypothetical protein BCR36DRAFT_405115 [Piromyces finnis]|eukprot:ORX48145.1 hypothetical protein BCR36DRAFT_405115 [Piromyces finnis]